MPNKRNVNGVEFVIHSNHPRYEEILRRELEEKWSELITIDLMSDSDAAEELFDFLKQRKLEIEEKVLLESLLSNRNINDVNLR